MRDILSIPAETVLVSIEDGGVLRRSGPLGPIPVLKVAFVSVERFPKRQLHRSVKTDRLVTLVTALFAESLLVLEDKPTVPRREDTTVVDLQCLLNVDHNEVIKLYSRTCISLGSTAWEQKPKDRVIQHTRDFAPEATLAGVRGGSFCKHLTAFT